MSGINEAIIFCVCRLRVHFHADFGNNKSILGTGFWLKTETQKDIFITNKHNLDARLKLGNNTQYLLTGVEIELRKQENGNITKETKFFRVINPNNSIITHNNDDVAIIESPNFEDANNEFRFFSKIKQSDLADDEFFVNNVSLMDIGSFIGFPGNKTSYWWDQEWNLGVARMMNIASYPSIPFSHPSIITGNTTLVSGLSFSGSSGSIVMLHQKGVNVGDGLLGGNYVSPKVLGIMSGHWQEETNIPQMFQHSGLSYFTRSSSILELITKV